MGKPTWRFGLLQHISKMTGNRLTAYLHLLTSRMGYTSCSAQHRSKSASVVCEHGWERAFFVKLLSRHREHLKTAFVNSVSDYVRSLSRRVKQ